MGRMTGADMLDDTTFKVCPRTVRLVWTDTRELIVEWPLAIAPSTQLEACNEALRLTRERFAVAS